MTEEQYKERYTEIERESEIKKIELGEEFGKSNNPYNVGDKITDHIGSILIEEIRYARECAYYNIPEIITIYYGIKLLKDGSPNKRGYKRYIWKSNTNKTLPI